MIREGKIIEEDSYIFICAIYAVAAEIMESKTCSKASYLLSYSESRWIINNVACSRASDISKIKTIIEIALTNYNYDFVMTLMFMKKHFATINTINESNGKRDEYHSTLRVLSSDFR
jgi:chitinase